MSYTIHDRYAANGIDPDDDDFEPYEPAIMEADVTLPDGRCVYARRREVEHRAGDEDPIQYLWAESQNELTVEEADAEACPGSSVAEYVAMNARWR